MMNTKTIILFTFILLIFNSCVDDITLDLPEVKQKVVVEGNIEQNSPPVVVLTRTTGYFKKADAKTLENLFVHNADVEMEGNGSSFQLTELCTDNLPDSIIDIIAASSDVTAKELNLINYCVYTTFDASAFGKLNNTYKLTIKIKDSTYRATTTIPKLIAPDSLWFETNPGDDSLGNLHFALQDPPGKGDAWRVFTKRLGKDERFIPCIGATFNDQYIDGKLLKFYFLRGSEFNSQAKDDKNEEAGYFKVGDTIDVKFCTIDPQSYDFWTTEGMAAGGGNPFMSPTTVKSNIEGGALGIW